MHCFWYESFATFSDNVEMTLYLISKEKPFLFVVLGDFNAKLSQWHNNDSSTSEGISTESIKSQFGLHQIANESTHLCVLTWFLPLNLIYQWKQELSSHSTLTVIIRFFTPNLILKSFTQHLTHARFCTISIQMLILSDNLLINLTEIKLLWINMWRKKF